jgi:hypothetical protein
MIERVAEEKGEVWPSTLINDHVLLGRNARNVGGLESGKVLELRVRTMTVIISFERERKDALKVEREPNCRTGKRPKIASTLNESKVEICEGKVRTVRSRTTDETEVNGKLL